MGSITQLIENLLVSQSQTVAVVTKHNAAHRAIGGADLAKLLQSATRRCLEGSQSTIGGVQTLIDAVQNVVGRVQSQPRRVVRAALGHGDGAQLLDARVLAMRVVERRDGLGVRRNVDQAGRGKVTCAQQRCGEALLEVAAARHCVSEAMLWCREEAQLAKTEDK